jgi:nucleotidyltransferase/DNA polymerase involved in DNA repair
LRSFYAQSECIRLGLPPDTTPLALMQWNSALAVTYPARSFGIKRGDTWQAIQEKSQGKSHAIHVGVLMDDETPTEETQLCSVEEEYRRIFQLSPQEQECARNQELGVRRFASQGKASIERYRIASAQIYRCVLDWIQQHYSSEITLERAGIDEFFLDVTACCKQATTEIIPEAMQATTIVGGTTTHQQPALQRGCVIAYQIRQEIKAKLGFTLSVSPPVQSHFITTITNFVRQKAPLTLVIARLLC